jgi:uncharacterized membrane protein YdbT with pleckstrin-like domain
MAGETYASKKDAWLMVILLSAAVVGAAAGAAMVVRGEQGGWLVFLVLGFVALLVFPTKYTLAGDAVAIRSGLFRWRVPYAEIRAVSPTRNPLSSPALSLDRLEIRYASGGSEKTIMISPERRQEFLMRLAQAAPQAKIQM